MAARQLLVVTENSGKKNVYLDEEVLTSFLLDEEVANKPVVVVSVAGAFRTGKSFLLNCMTRYLTATDKSRWLDNKTDSFEWKSGCDAHTKGIWMSPPIPGTLESGEEAVLVLLDTQGLFDDDSDTADSRQMFTLSTLFSSVQVLNLLGDLKSDDLDNLQLFAELSRLAVNQTENTPFQDILFLIRDWYHTGDYPLGKQGGNELVKKRMKSGIVEHRSPRTQHIEACFSNIGGFLLPHPGKSVTSNIEFAGSAKQMEGEFISALDELMSTLLSPERLVVKMNGNRPVTCREMATLIGTYTDVVKNGDVPGPKSILQAVAEVNNMAAVNAELNIYMKKMNKLLANDSPMLYEELLERRHNEGKSEALDGLGHKMTMRDSTKSKDYYSFILNDMLDESFATSQDMFKEKCAQDRLKVKETNEKLVEECLVSFEASMRCRESDRSVGEKQIRETYEIAEQETLQQFKRRKVKLGSYSPNDSQLKLKRAMKEKLELLIARDEEMSNREAVQCQFLRYKDMMESLLVEGAPMLHEGLVAKKHRTAKDEVVAALRPLLLKNYTRKPEDDFLCFLTDRVEEWLKASEQIFIDKCKENSLKAKEKNDALVDECMETFDCLMRYLETSEPVGESKLQDTYKEAKRRVLQYFDKERIAFDAYSAEESRLKMEKNMRGRYHAILAKDEEHTNSALVDHQFQKYQLQLEKLLVNNDQVVDSNIIEEKHVTAKCDAIKELKPQLTVKHSATSETDFLNLLAEKTEEWFKGFQEAVLSRCRQDRLKAADVNDSLVRECSSKFRISLLSHDWCFDEKTRLIEIEKARQSALQHFDSNRVTVGSYTAEDSRHKLEEALFLATLASANDHNRCEENRKVCERFRKAKQAFGIISSIATSVTPLMALAGPAPAAVTSAVGTAFSVAAGSMDPLCSLFVDGGDGVALSASVGDDDGEEQTSE